MPKGLRRRRVNEACLHERLFVWEIGVPSVLYRAVWDTVFLYLLCFGCRVWLMHFVQIRPIIVARRPQLGADAFACKYVR